MADHVCKIVDAVGSSTTGTDDASQQAFQAAAKTPRHIDCCEVIQTRGHVAGGKVAHDPVALKVGFRHET